MFFPKLLAGPIVAPEGYFRDLENNAVKNMVIEKIFRGLSRILWGISLKVVLADNIGGLVNQGFNLASDKLNAIDNIVIGLIFGFQIYFDFSAYSSIALGIALIFGFSFPENFNFPYIAKSPQEFWKRWHITLSGWVKRYIYKPMINIIINNTQYDNRLPLLVLSLPLLTTWTIMGLWHGASYSMILWGIMHGIYILVYRAISMVIEKMKFITERLKRRLSITLIPVNLLVVSVIWLPFRTDNLMTRFKD